MMSAPETVGEVIWEGGGGDKKMNGRKEKEGEKRRMESSVFEGGEKNYRHRPDELLGIVDSDRINIRGSNSGE